MRTLGTLAGLTCAMALALLAVPAAAQVAGFAEITFPQEGAPLDGLVTITGTADHPQFLGYQLAFAYDPNPTGTWFPLTERVESPVNDDRLALWDTSQITPGVYQLRLTVFTEEGSRLTASVGGIPVGTVPAAVAPQADRAEAAGSEAPSAPAADARRAEISEAAPPNPDRTLLRVVLFGAGSSAAALVGLGIYSFLRPRVRQYAGLLRMRRLRRQQQRRRQTQRRSR